ncbi:HD-GYP domain-containing protein [Methylobacterium sp. Gmos1]
MDDLLAGRIFERTRATLSRLFDEAADGRIGLDAVDDMVYPVMRVLQDGGVHQWLCLIHAHPSQDTVQHSMHVAGLAANLGHHLGLPACDCVALVRAGLLHDIGKARIPAEILNKPGALTDDEMALMRTHAAVGHDILRESGLRDPVVLQATRHHHEMIDGSGYPDHLAKEAVKDLVRLMSVCDIYAALTEARPYRPAMTRAGALGILRGMTPDRLDPTFVDAFEASLARPHTGWTTTHPAGAARLPDVPRSYKCR